MRCKAPSVPNYPTSRLVVESDPNIRALLGLRAELFLHVEDIRVLVHDAYRVAHARKTTAMDFVAIAVRRLERLQAILKKAIVHGDKILDPRKFPAGGSIFLPAAPVGNRIRIAERLLVGALRDLREFQQGHLRRERLVSMLANIEYASRIIEYF